MVIACLASSAHAALPSCVTELPDPVHSEVEVTITPLLAQDDSAIPVSEYAAVAARLSGIWARFENCIREVRSCQGTPATSAEEETYRDFLGASARLSAIIRGLEMAIDYKDPELRRRYIQNRLETGSEDPLDQPPVWDSWRLDYERYIGFGKGNI